VLTPVFSSAGAVAVIPIVLARRRPNAAWRRLSVRRCDGWLVAVRAIWSLWAANSAAWVLTATRVTYTGIVDERRFYFSATGNAHPLTAADYLDYPRMRAVLAH